MPYTVWLKNGSDGWQPSEPMPLAAVLDYLLSNAYGSEHRITTDVAVRLVAGARRTRRPAREWNPWEDDKPEPKGERAWPPAKKAARRDRSGVTTNGTARIATELV